MFPARSARLLLVILGSALLSSIGFGQFESPHFSLDERSVIAFPIAEYPVAPTHTIVGDFTGDLNDDVFLLVGTAGVIAYGPGQNKTLFDLPDASAAGLISGSHTGRADELLVVAQNGLVHLSNYAAGAFQQSEVVVDPDWAAARSVATHDLDCDLEADAFAMGADGVSVLVARDVLSGSALLSTITFTSSVYDVAAIQWGGQPALVVLTGDGAYVRRWDNTPVTEFTGGFFDGGFLVPLMHDAPAPDRVAAIYRVLDNQFLTVLFEQGPDSSIDLTGLDVYAGAAGDVTGNGLDDLLLVHEFNHHAILFPNESRSGPTFGSLQTIDLGPGFDLADTQTASPVLADFTRDGDVDLLVHVAALEELALLENLTTSVQSIAPDVKGGAYFFKDSEDYGILSLWVKAAGAVPFAQTHLEVTIWAQPGIEEPVIPVPVVHEFFKKKQGKYAVQVELLEEELETAHFYHVQLREVRRIGGELKKAGPTALWIFTTPKPAVSYLQTTHGSNGVGIRTFLVDPVLWLNLKQMSERSVSPVTVEGDKVPASEVPPDPFA